MLRRIFSRNSGTYQVIMTVFFLLFIVYEMKQLYNKFQKEKRISFYNTYVNEVYHFADTIKDSEVKSSSRVKELTRLLQVIFKKNNASAES